MKDDQDKNYFVLYGIHVRLKSNRCAKVKVISSIIIFNSITVQRSFFGLDPIQSAST